jgi:uncharacterized protein
MEIKRRQCRKARNWLSNGLRIFDYGEVRFNSIGVVVGIVFLVVTHTDREGRTHIISARPAKQKERQRYVQAIQQGTGS